MKIQTLSLQPGAGWAAPIDASLDGDATMILLFGAPQLIDAPAPVTALLAALPRAHAIGCSTAGEIHGTCVGDHGAVAAIVRFERTAIRTAVAEVARARDSRAAGAQLGAALADPALRAVLVLSDGLTVNGSALVAGLAANLAPGVTITGGLAGDGSRFLATWVMHAGALRRGVVTALGLYGPHLRIGHGSRGGWDIFGPERVITRSDGNVLYELDGKPALQLYKDYLGDRAAELPASALLFPLALRTAAGSSHRVVRTVLAVDDATASLTFAGDVPQGALAQLMRANFDRLVQGASDAAAMSQVPAGGPILSIAISCVGRRLVLGERIEEETEATLEALPAGTQQIGFYSYGEISPHADGTCELHNQTMTLTTIGEAG